MKKLDPTPDGVRLLLKVVPGASRDSIAGWLGERLKIRVSAPPEHGKANEAVCRTLARALGVNRRDVRIISGHASAEKTAEIRGLTSDQALALLAD